MKNNELYKAGLYCRLSKDDDQAGESVSIGTQRAILADYCTENQFAIHKVYVDDGYSGLNFNRPGFLELIADVENGAINMVITKDLSRLGRDYIMTGYYSEVYFPSKNVRYIAISDGFDSLKHDNDIAPFKNILNFMYAKDLSRKVKNAKRQRAKQGLFMGSQAPYGYQRDPNNKSHLIIDPEAAEVVRQIFLLAEQGAGSVVIASTLEARGVLSPSAYKGLHGGQKLDHDPVIKSRSPYSWCATTISGILNNPLYTGTLISLKTESVDCKTKQRKAVEKARQIKTPNAHEAIISQEQFDRVHEIRASHRSPARVSLATICSPIVGTTRSWAMTRVAIGTWVPSLKVFPS